MNLNNKYLAIGLSAAAAGLLFYQIFINKACDPKPSVRPQSGEVEKAGPSPPQVPISPQPQAQTNAAGSVNTNGEESVQTADASQHANNGLTIDYNSPMLLNRIHSQMAQKHPHKELPPQVGKSAFTRGIEPSQKQETTKKAIEKEVKFELNAIIMDAMRKLAIINGVIVKEGDMVAGAKINIIAKSKVILKINNQTVILSTNSRIQTVRLLGGNGEVNR